MTKILVIEDDPLVKENLAEILDLEGFEVITASNGQEGIESAKKNLPDLILCDVMMPEMDGYTVLTNLKNNHDTKNIPLIFLTAKADMASLRSGMNLGADDYITKPYEINQLLISIQNRLAKKASLLEEAQEQAQLEFHDFRYHITRSQPQKITDLTNKLHEIAGKLKQRSEYLTVQEIEDTAEKLEKTTNAIQRLWINFSLYFQLEMIAMNPKARDAYLSKRGHCVPGVILNQVSTSKAIQYERLQAVKLTVQDTKIAISGTNFKKIVEEILDNAFRYSQFDSPVEIITKIEDNNFQLFIIDSGQGIPVSLIDDLLISAHNGYKDANQSLGLGLLIAKHLIELNGGSLSIESLLNKQTIVHLTFPLAI